MWREKLLRLTGVKDRVQVGEEKGGSHSTYRSFLLSTTKELGALQQVWEITRDWEENWNQWKTGRFLTLQTEAMETMAHGLFRRLTRLAKEYKVGGEREALEEGGLSGAAPQAFRCLSLLLRTETGKLSKPLAQK